MKKVVCGLLILVMTACAMGSSEVGKWTSAENKGTVEFKKDGSFVVLDNMEAVVKGTYTRGDGDIELKITETNIMRKGMGPVTPPEVINATMVIKGDTLSLTNIAGDTEEVETYIRT